jgi:hypothetical protein
MQNEKEEKKTWQTPDIYDLDVNETAGKFTAGGESFSTGPS